MNRILTVIGILILIMLGLIEAQLYSQSAALNAIWSRLEELSAQVDDLASQPDGSEASDEAGQCTTDQPRQQI